jgi:hypothetical protein
VLCVFQKVKIVDDRLILIKLSETALLGLADALFLAHRMRQRVSSEAFIYLHK